ncbi:MAG: N-methyl-D-aspartate receptor NMDAR2C subunit [Candidatus Liptonbacteria bacterium]|nr:N-methyl-D-aspartate receptor NMDAR2C subunit [Candidatus Liptonbacteria bacterium]
MQDRGEKRWLSLWQRIGARGDAAAVYKDLVARYAEPHRAYHALPHIEQCLDELRGVSIPDPGPLEIALWYHDAIYDTRAKDNEEKSAELCLSILKRASLPDSFGERVAGLILATKHPAVPIALENQLIVDIDLSILGQYEKVFDEYELQIRKEYEWVPNDAFASGRAAILRSFLDRETIFSTRLFIAKYELQARRNIVRSLVQISPRPQQ